VIEIVQADLYTINESIDEMQGVLVISYLCKLIKKSGGFEIEGEAGSAQFKKFPLSEIETLNIPQFYKTAILKATKL